MVKLIKFLHILINIKQYEIQKRQLFKHPFCFIFYFLKTVCFELDGYQIRVEEEEEKTK